ncbi:GH25 family lysozyme [Actinokineospora guangxiensis]|uniref:GH25 family lysozyme n=1 Tax=Actinokineospora guangxiensis TaxID=1490288 RepID=A0ABW0EV16_9PSEU
MLVQAVVAAGHATSVTGPVPPGLATGVDVSTWQAGIDFGQVRAAGHTFAIVKAGGSPPAEGPYTSPHYANQVAGARSAGLRVGHYWVSGDFSTPVRAADHFVANLHDYRRGDVLSISWGYRGPIDGVMGPNSWRAFARFVNQDTYD